VRVDVAEAERIGHGDGDVLSLTPILGGTVEGPRLTGTVVPGGGDWSIERGKGVIELDARYLLRADDGALIDIVNRGFYRVSPEYRDRAEAGEAVRRPRSISTPRRSSGPTRRLIAGCPRRCSSAWPSTTTRPARSSSASTPCPERALPLAAFVLRAGVTPRSGLAVVDHPRHPYTHGETAPGRKVSVTGG
jgi:hypothetical protein